MKCFLIIILFKVFLFFGVNSDSVNETKCCTFHEFRWRNFSELSEKSLVFDLFKISNKNTIGIMILTCHDIEFTIKVIQRAIEEIDKIILV